MIDGKLISILIPVYNTDAYLTRCLDSILIQNNNFIEIILVNDGSTDNSLEICREYAEKYPCIKVIDQENKGVSAARNAGLERASGTYVWHIDSDDWIEPGSMDFLRKIIEQNDPDAIQITYTRKEDIDIKNTPIHKYDSYEELREGEIWKAFVEERLMSYTGCLLAKKTLYLSGNILFPVGRLYEDTATIYKILAEARTVCVVSEPIYNYYFRTDSTTGTFTSKKLLYLFESIEEELRGVERICNRYQVNEFKYFKLNCYVQLLIFFYKAHLDRKDDFDYNHQISDLKMKINSISLTISELLQYRTYSMFKHYVLHKFGLLVPALRFISRWEA